jgi:SRSO17 transposase
MLYGFPVWSPSILSDVGIAYENADLLNKLFDGYIVEYKHCFNHKAQEVHFRLYLRGLLSDLERKSVEPIALMYGGESAVRTLQIFVKSSVLSDDLLLDQYNRMLSEAVSDDDGMLTVDGCDFVKRGTHSVGVSRQHCGPLGKTDSCQASVMIGYSGKEGYGLIDRRLYMPEKWMSDEYAEMRKKCEVPEDIKFQTKNQIAIELLTSAYNSGIFKAKWVGADSAFGHDTKFLDAIPKELFYVANVHADDMFYVKMPKIQSPKWYGIGRKPIRPIINEKPSKVRDIIEKSKIKWETVEFGYGSKGMIIGQEMALRVADIRNGLPNKLVWLYARKWDDGRVKYLISNAPEDTSIEKLRELSLRRWAIEQCFEECKSCLGMDHYEGRSWKGWHRHVLFVFIAHLLLLLIRKKFSVEFHQLSEHGKKIFKDKKRNNGIGTKVAFLTTSMARDVCNLFFLKDKSFFRHAINKINYTIKRYAMSFISFCKRQKNRVLSSFP